MDVEAMNRRAIAELIRKTEEFINAHCTHGDGDGSKLPGSRYRKTEVQEEATTSVIAAKSDKLYQGHVEFCGIDFWNDRATGVFCLVKCHKWSERRFADILLELRNILWFVGVACLGIFQYTAEKKVKMVCQAVLCNTSLRKVTIIVECYECDYDRSKDIRLQANMALCEENLFLKIYRMKMRDQEYLEKVLAAEECRKRSELRGLTFLDADAPTDYHFMHRKPVIALCFNNYYFSKEKQKLDKRRGNAKDVANVRSICENWLIPLMLFRDMSRSAVVKIIEVLRYTNFYSFQHLFLFIFSHGCEHDTIHTKDGDFDLYDDVVRPLESNISLQTVKVVMPVAACRGKMPGFISRPSSDASPARRPLMDNFNIFFSSPPGYKSYRSPKKGTNLMQAFTEECHEPPQGMPLDELSERLRSRMVNNCVRDRGVDTILGRSDDHLDVTQFVWAGNILLAVDELFYSLRKSLARIPVDEQEDHIEGEEREEGRPSGSSSSHDRP